MDGGARIQTQVLLAPRPQLGDDVVLLTPHMTHLQLESAPHTATEEAVSTTPEGSSRDEMGPCQLRATCQETWDPANRGDCCFRV